MKNKLYAASMLVLLSACANLPTRGLYARATYTPAENGSNNYQSATAAIVSNHTETILLKKNTRMKDAVIKAEFITKSGFWGTTTIVGDFTITPVSDVVIDSTPVANSPSYIKQQHYDPLNAGPVVRVGSFELKAERGQRAIYHTEDGDTYELKIE